MNSQQRYISNELTHFVGKGKNSEEQYQLLLKILKEGILIHQLYNAITTGNVSGTCMKVCPTAKLSKNEMFNPEMVCFCDIPVGDLNIHIRKYKSPFGLSFTKNFIVQHGGSPVYYIPRKAAIKHTLFAHSGNNKNKGELFDKIVPELLNSISDIEDRPCSGTEFSSLEQKTLLKKNLLRSFLEFHIFSYLKFFDHELKEDEEKNYYFEREWRIVGNLKFKISDIKRIFIPENYTRLFRKDFPQYYGQLTFADLPKERKA